ncbi:MucR family transcriptional regulator [Sphingomonas crocodyli]|uniref:MucR family transcriptional regulator n=1 Tax=Sphingomonas crocodyli TaxID=1979270 RepID=UPI0026C816C7
MNSEDLIGLTAQIVTSHVESNRVNMADVPALIQSVYGALTNLGSPAPVPEVPQEPAVSIRTSVKPDSITCLECGSKQKMLKRHLSNAHGLTPVEYRAKWKLPTSYPLVAPNYADVRRQLAHKIGLGKKEPVKAPTRRKRSS